MKIISDSSSGLLSPLDREHGSPARMTSPLAAPASTPPTFRPPSFLSSLSLPVNTAAHSKDIVETIRPVESKLPVTPEPLLNLMADTQAIKSTAAKLSKILQPKASPKAIKVLSNQNQIMNTEGTSVSDEITQMPDNLASPLKSVTAAGDSMKIVNRKPKAKTTTVSGKNKLKGSAKIVPIKSSSKPKPDVYQLSSAVKIVDGTPCSAAKSSTLNVSPTVQPIIPAIFPARDCFVKLSSIKATASCSSPKSIFDPEDLTGESLQLLDQASTASQKSQRTLSSATLKPATKKAKTSKRSGAKMSTSSHNPKPSGMGVEVSSLTTHGTSTSSIAGKISLYLNI